MKKEHEVARVDTMGDPSDSPTAPSRGSYDDRQIGAVLTRCVRCLREFYMTKPQALCAECSR